MDEPSSPYLDRIGGSTEEILNVRGEIAKRRTWLSALIERVGRVLSRPAFFLALFAGHLLWILLNLPIYPWFAPWDPYPFTFLATIASVESPFIALLVLMHQQRSQRVSELRAETHLQVALHVDREVSKALQLLEKGKLEKRKGEEAVEQDSELLHRLEEELDPQRLMENVRRDLRRAEGGDSPTAP